MTTLFRYSRYTLTCLSLAVIILVICIWRRTINFRDELRYVTGAGVLYTMATHPHGVTISRRTHCRDEPRSDWYRPLTPDGFSFATERWWATYSRDISPHRLLEMGKVANGSTGFIESTFAYETVIISPRHDLKFGFGLRSNAWETDIASREVSISAPLFFLVAMASIFPFLSLAEIRSGLRRRRRRRQNRCTACGYNLTGNTSGVCSECGSICD